jgi:hypothetical protein
VPRSPQGPDAEVSWLVRADSRGEPRGCHKAVGGRPRLKDYLASERRVPFKETGILRRYLELDVSTKGVGASLMRR